MCKYTYHSAYQGCTERLCKLPRITLLVSCQVQSGTQVTLIPKTDALYTLFFICLFVCFIY